MRVLVKLSGKVLEEGQWRKSLAEETAGLGSKGNELILVHGGGRQLSDYCRELGIPVVQKQGRRVTDPPTLEAAKKVFGAVNADLVTALLSVGVKAVGISAFDGFLTQSRKRPPMALSVEGTSETVDFGLVGDIVAIDPTIVETLWSKGFVPVVSSLCADASGQVLNINADTLASELALVLGVDRLVAVSDVDGLCMDPADPETRIPELDLAQAQRLLESGVFRDGMVPKVENALRILEKGVRSFQIISGLQSGALENCLERSSGTLIRAGRVQDL